MLNESTRKKSSHLVSQQSWRQHPRLFTARRYETARVHHCRASTWVVPTEPHSGKAILFPAPLKFLGTNSSSVPRALCVRASETAKHMSRHLALESTIVAHGRGRHLGGSSCKLRCTPGRTNNNDREVRSRTNKRDSRRLVCVCCCVLLAYLAKESIQCTKTIGSNVSVVAPCATQAASLKNAQGCSQGCEVDEVVDVIRKR